MNTFESLSSHSSVEVENLQSKGLPHASIGFTEFNRTTTPLQGSIVLQTLSSHSSTPEFQRNVTPNGSTFLQIPQTESSSIEFDDSILTSNQPRFQISINELEKIKLKIENMTKQHQIEILKIFKKYNHIKLNENKSGVFINLSFLPKLVIDEINKFILYIDAQENSIQYLENQCEEYKNTFFTEKDNKDNVMLYNRE